MKTIRFPCPHCGHVRDVSASDPGKSFECTACAKSFVFQPPPGALVEPPIPPTPSPARRQGWKFWFCGGCGLLALGGAVAITVWIVQLRNASLAAVTGSWTATFDVDGKAHSEIWVINDNRRYRFIRITPTKDGQQHMNIETGTWELDSTAHIEGRIYSVGLKLTPDQPTPTATTWKDFHILRSGKLCEMDDGEIVKEYRRLKPERRK